MQDAYREVVKANKPSNEELGGFEFFRNNNYTTHGGLRKTILTNWFVMP